MNVTKRDGSVEPINLDKIHRVITWGAEGLDVSVSQVELNAHLQLFDGIKTSDIHALIVKSAADLITTETPDYQYLAARLKMFALRKEAYGRFEPPHLRDHIERMIDLGRYEDERLPLYSDEELELLNAQLTHDRDFTFTYAATVQWESKYLVQDRVDKRVYESPQMAYMAQAMVLHANYQDRLSRVARYYEACSTFKISLPTPIMGGVRTPTKQFSSCVKIDIDDSLDSIIGGVKAAVKYISQRAGLGLNIGRIRGVGSKVRNGDVYHTGVLPFLKLLRAAVKSCSQGGARGGAATVFYPLWHIEAEQLLVLKNNRGTEETRERHLDYGVQLNRTMYERLLTGGNITLFSPADTPGLYDAYFGDPDRFATLYEMYEADPTIRKKTVKAVDLFSSLVQERAQTGRIYVMNADHMNTHSAFTDTVYMSNLCVAPETEILTRQGYKQIAAVAGTKQDVWNGQEWSEVDVLRTGTNQPLLRVEFNDGNTLECTPYHKFYVQTGYDRGTGANRMEVKEVRAHELQPGDKMIKFDLPTVEHGFDELPFAYENGFYTGDGTTIGDNCHRLYFYGDKKALLPHIRFGDSAKVRFSKSSDRVEVEFRGTTLMPKFFVPDASYSLASRLEWLAGFADADGTIARNGANQSLQLSSCERAFLVSISRMLQEFGIASKLNNGQAAGLRPMPDGRGGSKEYECRATYRLLVNSAGLQKLMALGFAPKRLRVGPHTPNRDAKHFVTVTGIFDDGRISDTYCFTELKRHMGVFNGVLTGQCMEIALPTTPVDVEKRTGEVALCTLAAVNLGACSEEDIPEVTELIVYALDALLSYQDYPIREANLATARRSLGVGITNYAYYLAKNGVKYSDGSANNLTHRLMEQIQFHLLAASNRLAQDIGACAYFHRTKYAKGLLPIDTYKRDVDSICSEPLHCDWEGLRRSIEQFGLRNSTVTALMPCETSSQITNSTNGIEPPRGLVSTKGNKDGLYKQVVPEIGQVDYELLWDIPNNRGYLELVAIMQKFVDQSISANTNYDPARFADGRVPVQVLLQDLALAYKLGIKTLYYHNTRDGSDTSEDDGCAGGACKL